MPLYILLMDDDSLEWWTIIPVCCLRGSHQLGTAGMPPPASITGFT